MLHTLLSRVGLSSRQVDRHHESDLSHHAFRHVHDHVHGHDEPHAQMRPCVPGVDCEDCPNREVEAGQLPLCLLEPGTRASVVSVGEGRRFRKRLADLGLAPGMEVRVLRASRGRGPMILGLCGDSRIAMGWGMANRIDVKVLRS